MMSFAFLQREGISKYGLGMEGYYRLSFTIDLWVSRVTKQERTQELSSKTTPFTKVS